LKLLAQEIGISKSSAAKVTKWWISTYLNGVECVHVQGHHFQHLLKKGKFILSFMWSNTWLLLGKSCCTWWWVMQFLPGAEKWQLCSDLSVNLLYNTCCRNLNEFHLTYALYSFFFLP
jgi:hypothetical protein